ncbi:MAG: DNA methyltransferase [Actinobacteria bacterium]|nr:DNA methyltransferase [Actinomycetota bacterium]
MLGLTEEIAGHVTTNPGDFVLDFFLGSGTTAAVAQKMGRRWIGVEWSSDNVATFAKPRLEMVVKGDDPGGVSQVHGWAGGVAFDTCELPHRCSRKTKESFT